MILVLLQACGSGDVAWAVHHATLVPTETGVTGTQTWEFFDAGWADRHDAEHFVCARAQEIVGEVVVAPEGCAGCTVAYALTATELGGDCEGALADAPAYDASLVVGIGEVAPALDDLDPYPGRSMGWYAAFAGDAAEAYGFAYVETLDWQGELGSPGWVADQAYTLWPAYAWDLR